AVNHMYRQGITGVDFIICNTDAQALELSPIPNKVQLGSSLTEGMGAGSIPEVGKNSAIENIDDVKAMLGSTTKMLFITAGMGGGTGTGASPIIAQAAKELDILTVAIITTPFAFEGKRRKMQADDGLDELKKYVDSYLVISNDRLREIFGNLTLGSAFAQADDILTTAAKGIAEIITVPGYINVDFKDVRTVMKDSGVSIMGSYSADGENRALAAVEGALASPLLKDNEIEGARYILLNISSGLREVTMDEVTIITDYIQDKAGLSADLIWGNCIDEHLEDKLSVTIIATGFQTTEQRAKDRQNVKKISLLTPEEAPLVRPVEPVNSFIEAKPQPVATEPVLKVQEEPKQSDLFGDLFNAGRATKVEEPENAAIIHHLIEEEAPVAEAQETGFEFEVKLSETDFVFETPTAQFEEEEITFTPEPPIAEAPVITASGDTSAPGAIHGAG
ncbi:MAG: cell division protein FtsZ, partial [Pedobacter sp.]